MNLDSLKTWWRTRTGKCIESRLVTRDRDLFMAIRAASRAQHRDAAIAVARWAVARVALEHPTLDLAFSRLASRSRLGSKIAATLDGLVEDLDSTYFDLKEQQETGTVSRDEVQAAFGRARAANSVAFALMGDAGEATYEALAATDDLPHIREVVLSALSQHDLA